MTNVVKHAGAEQRRVKVEENDPRSKVTVEDDGSGLPAEGNGHEGSGSSGCASAWGCSGASWRSNPRPKAARG